MKYRFHSDPAINADLAAGYKALSPFAKRMWRGKNPPPKCDGSVARLKHYNSLAVLRYASPDFVPMSFDDGGN